VFDGDRRPADPGAGRALGRRDASVHRRSSRADRGWLDLRRSALESLTGIARAGADVIVTYFAIEAASWLSER
jgi:hypothetical protein